MKQVLFGIKYHIGCRQLSRKAQQSLTEISDFGFRISEFKICNPQYFSSMLLWLTVVLDIDSFDNKNHGLGYVGGEVGAALEATRDDDGVHC